MTFLVVLSLGLGVLCIATATEDKLWSTPTVNPLPALVKEANHLLAVYLGKSDAASFPSGSSTPSGENPYQWVQKLGGGAL